uniref:Uncharacterized protein n=1 Tax=Leersia perrieri TaxID=77586 RepID=A0A0D9X7N2_9ORYZ
MASVERSGLQSLVARAKVNVAPMARRCMSSAHDDAREMAKWEKITYAGVVTLMEAYNLSKGDSP